MTNGSCGIEEQAWFKSFPNELDYHNLTKKKEKKVAAADRLFFLVQMFTYSCLLFLIKCSKSLAGIGLLNTLP